LDVPLRFATANVAIPVLVSKVPGTLTDIFDAVGVGLERIVTLVADPPGGVKLTVCEPGVKFAPDKVKVVVAALRATTTGITLEIDGAGWLMAKGAPLDCVVVVRTMSARTVAEPGAVKAVLGTVTVSWVALEAVGVRFEVPEGPIKRTVGTVMPTPGEGNVPLT
jgi:hypothetical protein